MAHISKYDKICNIIFAGVRKIVYKRIRELRIDNDLNQEEIAHVIDICRTTYSKYETGNLKIPTWVLEKLAIFYDTSADYLLRTRRRKVKKIINTLCQKVANHIRHFFRIKLSQALPRNPPEHSLFYNVVSMRSRLIQPETSHLQHVFILINKNKKR